MFVRISRINYSYHNYQFRLSLIARLVASMLLSATNNLITCSNLWEKLKSYRLNVVYIIIVGVGGWGGGQFHEGGFFILLENNRLLIAVRN